MSRLSMEDATRKASRPKSRQSLAHPTATTGASKGDKENFTADVAVLQRAYDALNQKKKLRGKSLGPGGLDALKETSGNAVKVNCFSQCVCVCSLTEPRMILLLLYVLSSNLQCP